MHIALQPQEVEVFYILPAIRRELTRALKALGKPQKEIAQLLGVTEAAVSQYLSAKRASEVQFPEELAKEIRTCAPRITDRSSMIRETQAILSASRKDGLICRMHEQVAAVPKGCDVCFKGGK
jgi:predicted transcriptional regulator